VQPVIWNVFVSLPLNGTTTGYLEQTLPQIAAAKAICLLTVEPDQGLAAVTASAVQELATYITTYEKVNFRAPIYCHSPCEPAWAATCQRSSVVSLIRPSRLCQSEFSARSEIVWP
jgi:hypothetical protein